MRGYVHKPFYMSINELLFQMHAAMLIFLLQKSIQTISRISNSSERRCADVLMQQQSSISRYMQQTVHNQCSQYFSQKRR